MRVKSRVMPPWIGSTWPSRLVPAPNGTTGTPRPVRVAQDGGDLVGRLREDDDVGTLRRVVREVGRVLVADGVAVADAVLVGDEPEELGAQVGGDRHARER